MPFLYYFKGYETLAKYQRDNREGFWSNFLSEMKHFTTTLRPQAQQILNASAAMELEGVSA